MHIPAMLIFALGLGLAVPLRVDATHETDHRYTVKGHLLDADRRPVTGEPVTVRSQGEHLGGGRSNSAGAYQVMVHLHDDDLGKPLEIRSSAGEGTVRVSLTPGDTVTQRIHRVNFVGGRLVEGELDDSPAPNWAYVAGAALVALVLGALAAGRMKRATRVRRREEVAASQPAAGKRRRKRKRKR